MKMKSKQEERKNIMIANVGVKGAQMLCCVRWEKKEVTSKNKQKELIDGDRYVYQMK